MALAKHMASPTYVCISYTPAVYPFSAHWLPQICPSPSATPEESVPLRVFVKVTKGANLTRPLFWLLFAVACDTQTAEYTRRHDRMVIERQSACYVSLLDKRLITTMFPEHESSWLAATCPAMMAVEFPHGSRLFLTK